MYLMFTSVDRSVGKWHSPSDGRAWQIASSGMPCVHSFHGTQFYKFGWLLGFS